MNMCNEKINGLVLIFHFSLCFPLIEAEFCFSLSYPYGYCFFFIMCRWLNFLFAVDVGFLLNLLFG
jgi:hypothetical protein